MINNWEIKNRLLYKDNVQVQLEVGNPEQMRFLKSREKLKKEYKNGLVIRPIVVPSREFEAILRFECICSNEKIVCIEQINDDKNFEFPEYIECLKCKTYYKCESQGNDILIKIS